MRLIQMFTGLAVSIVLMACAAVQGYEGPALPDSETALITAGSGSPVWIGVSVPGTRMTQKLRLSPGYSCVNVEAAYGGVADAQIGAINRGNSIGEELELCFQANAGKTYDVTVLLLPGCVNTRSDGRCRRREWSFQSARIEDAETGEVLDVKEAI